jgi:hypothetical protein
MQPQASHNRLAPLTAHALTGGSVWLKKWSEANDVAGGNPDVVRYILVYFAFGIGSAFLVVVQTLILWILCSIEVSAVVPHPSGFEGFHRRCGPDFSANKG